MLLGTGAVDDPTTFETKCRKAVRDVVHLQRETGLDIINDGEDGEDRLRELRAGPRGRNRR